MDRITLFLMTSKGYAVLDAVLKAFPSSVIHSVVGARDNNIEDDHFKEIEELCLRNQVAFYDRKDVKETKTKYSFAISWRWLISLKPEQRLIVLHDSLLPKYRGFAPLVNSLVNGETSIGVTALFANEEYDRGEIIAQRSSVISYPLKVEEAISINAGNYVQLAVQVIGTLYSGSPLESTPQNESEATYSLWRDEEDYEICWNEPAHKVKRFIDATGYPYKGAYTTLDGVKLRVREAVIVPDVTVELRQPGKVIFVDKGCPTVVCSEGLLKLTIVTTDETNEDFIPIKKFRCRFK